jgi:hypothetical protein
LEDSTFDQFIKERRYLQNVSERTIQRYEESFKWLNNPNPSQADLKSPIARNEADFRRYVDDRMSDPAFRAQAITDLRGKHLLCWCRESGPQREEFCHARVWLEIVNK